MENIHTSKELHLYYRNAVRGVFGLGCGMIVLMCGLHIYKGHLWIPLLFVTIASVLFIYVGLKAVQFMYMPDKSLLNHLDDTNATNERREQALVFINELNAEQRGPTAWEWARLHQFMNNIKN